MAKRRRRALGALNLNGCPREGMSVRVAHDANRAGYKPAIPPAGYAGRVTAVGMGSTKRTCLVANNRTLIYVRFDKYGTMPVAAHDLDHHDGLGGLMAKRKRRNGLGYTAEEHVRRGVRIASSARLEAKVVRTHIARGECAAAIRGLAMVGWANGRMASERDGAEPARRRKGSRFGTVTARTARDLRNLADKVIKACRTTTRKGG